MNYILLDESGDLGFNFTKKKTSKFFIITFIFIENKRLLEKIVSKTYKELKKQHKRKGGVLHCYKEKPITRKRLLRRLIEKNCSIMTVYLNKKKVHTKLQDEKAVLYNFVTNILLDRICTKELLPKDEQIILIASKKDTNKFLNENFKSYLKKSLDNKHKLKIKIEIKTPFEEKSLQVVDFVSWSIFRQLEHGDKIYYDLIKEKIVEESPLFP